MIFGSKVPNLDSSLLKYDGQRSSEFHILVFVSNRLPNVKVKTRFPNKEKVVKGLVKFP